MVATVMNNESLAKWEDKQTKVTNGKTDSGDGVRERQNGGVRLE